MAPFSTKELEEIQPFEVFIKSNKINGLKEDSKILLNRLRAVARKNRLRNCVGSVDKETMKKVKGALDIVLWRYQIEVPFWGYNKERVENELANIDNKPLKKIMKENYRLIYTHWFYLSDNPHLDYFKWSKISQNLSEKGKEVVIRELHEGKIYYLPANFLKEKRNSKREIEWVSAEIDLGYGYKKEVRKLTNLNDYQIILNNPEGKPDLIEFEKDFDLLVSIENKIEEALKRQYPRITLDSSRSLQDKEIEEFRKQWEGDGMFIFLPPGVSSVKDTRPSLGTKKLREEFKKIEESLEHKINKDIRKNEIIKFEERVKALKEMKRKWGIIVVINHRYPFQNKKQK